MEPLGLIGTVTLVVSISTSVVVTMGVIAVAPRLGALDHPGPRKVHTTPIPRIGGVGVFAGFMAGVAYAAWASGRVFDFAQVDVYWAVMGGCAFLMFAMGLADDLLQLSFKTKFAVQVLAAVAVWLSGFRIETLTHPIGQGVLDLGMLSLPVTLLWIVGVTNAINLIDGLDGLAAGTALIMTGAVACIALIGGHLGVVATAVALVGALLGFLVFNFNPARIFLGDSGSMLLGFVLAVISIRGSQKGSTAVAVLTPLLVLGLPLLDTSMAIVRRLARLTHQGPRGSRLVHVVRNVHHVFLPDRGHVHHRLLDLGFGHRRAVLILYGVVLVSATAALASVVKNSLLVTATVLLAVVVLTSVVLLLVGARVRRRRTSSIAAGAERNNDRGLAAASSGD